MGQLWGAPEQSLTFKAINKSPALIEKQCNNDTQLKPGIRTEMEWEKSENFN